MLAMIANTLPSSPTHTIIIYKQHKVQFSMFERSVRGPRTRSCACAAAAQRLHAASKEALLLTVEMLLPLEDG